MSVGSAVRVGAPILAFILAFHDRAAAGPNTVVAVDCPALGSESRAALEARAKTELLVRDRAGTFVALCRDGVVELTWHPVVGTGGRSTALMSNDAETTIERVLEALDELMSAPAPAEAAAAPPPETTTTPTPADPHADQTPRERRALQAAVVAPSDDLPSQAPVTFGAAVGVVAESWSPEVLGAVGPRSRLRLGISPHFSLDAGAQIAWTLKSPESVNGRFVRLQAGAAYTLDSRGVFRLGFDAFVDFLHATADASLGTPPADHATVGGLFELGCRVVSSDVFALSLGPAVFLRPGRVSARLGDHEVFGIPPVLIGAMIELAVDSGRPSSPGAHAARGSGHE